MKVENLPRLLEIQLQQCQTIEQTELTCNCFIPHQHSFNYTDSGNGNHNDNQNNVQMRTRTQEIFPVYQRYSCRSVKRQSRLNLLVTVSFPSRTTRSHDTKSHMLLGQLSNGTSNATCSLACVILYHVNGSCKGPIIIKM